MANGNLIFFGGNALTTYLHKIAPPEDLKPTLSMGVTMNHISCRGDPEGLLEREREQGDPGGVLAAHPAD